MKSRYHKRILLFTFIITAIISCTASGDKDNQVKAVNNNNITDAILQKMDQYVDALNRQDSAALINSYVSGSEFRLYSDGKLFSNEEMKMIASGLKNGYTSVNIIWDTILVTLPSNTVALATAPFHRRMVDKSGKVIQDRGVANWLFVNRDGEWKMLFGHGDHHPE